MSIPEDLNAGSSQFVWAGGQLAPNPPGGSMAEVAALLREMVGMTRELLENSRQQYLNVQGAFGVDRAACLAGPVLLIDDVVDSRWTLAEVGRQLRRSGVVAAVPFTLASASPAG